MSASESGRPFERLTVQAGGVSERVLRLLNRTVRRVELHWYEAHGIGKRDFKNQELFGLAMKQSSKEFALCIDNEGNEASLILGKVYRVLPDSSAAKDDLISFIRPCRIPPVRQEEDPHPAGRRLTQKPTSQRIMASCGRSVTL